MKANILFAAIVTISFAASGAMIAGPALAQNARYHFAPQYYPLEQSHLPVSPANNIPFGTVSRGSVPAKGFFGIDLGFFQKLANNTAPRTQQLSFNFWPNVKPQPQPVFRSEFGRPIQPQSPAPQAMSQPSQPKAAYYPSAKVLATRQVQAHLRSASKFANSASGAGGSLTKPVANYGNSFYVSGSTAPAVSGTTATVKTFVGGRLVNMRVH